MSTRIYKEAIEEASDLIRMAEENAKNKLIEAFAPRIRAMVEKSLFESSEEGSDREDDMDDLLFSMEEESEEESDEDTDEVPSQETPPVQDFQLKQQSPPAEMHASGVDLHIPTGVKSVTLQMEGEEMELTSESIESLLRIVDGQPSLLDRAKGLRLELKMLGRALNALNEGTTPKSAALQIVEEFNAILRKSIGLKQELQESKGASNEAAKNEFSQLLKEISEMSTRTLLRNLLRESNNFSLYEAEDEEDLMSAEEPSEDEEAPADEEADEGDAEVDVDAIKSAVEQLAAALGMDLASEESEEAEEEEESEEAEEEEESKEEGENYEMHYEMADQDEMHYEAYEQEEGADLEEGDVVYEIDESTIARALMEARKRRAKLGESDMAHHFGGGSKAKEVKLNALSEKEKVGGKSKKSKKPEDAVEGMKKATDADHMKEARSNRASQARLNEAARAVETLRRQLSEQKLFNAKLLYVNKLMQNRALSDKQLKSVVEAIDSAKTIREAKLLYTSLSESLVTTGGRLAEGARNAGGSSRPVRSGAMLNESGGDVDRWARLAGLVSE